jgi:TonB-dependent receptor
LDELTEEHQYTEELNTTGKFNLRIPISKSAMNNNALKLGAKYKKLEKKRDNNFYEYSPLSGFENMSQSQIADKSDPDFLAGNYLIGEFTTQEYLGSQNLENSGLFEKEDKKDEYAADNFTADETVIAGYAQYEHTLANDWLFILGVRVENTDINYKGNEYNENDDSVTPTSGKDSYTNVLPGIHVKYQMTPASFLRFAWTNTLARPDYYQLVPFRSISEDNEELVIGNPSLQPTLSMNFDLMYDHYLPSIGLLMGGVFYKDIQDFIYIYQEDDFVDPVTGNTYDEFFQPRNGAEASLIGFELALQRQFDFLPGFWRNFGIIVNYTYTSSNAKSPDFGDREIDLPGSAPHTLNLSLSYQDERLLLNGAFNYSSPYLDPDGLDLTPGLERYYDTVTYLDFNGSYAFTPQWRFFFEFNNMLNQPLRYYAGTEDRTYQQEFYNWRMNAGIKFDL